MSLCRKHFRISIQFFDLFFGRYGKAAASPCKKAHVQTFGAALCHQRLIGLMDFFAHGAAFPCSASCIHHCLILRSQQKLHIFTRDKTNWTWKRFFVQSIQHSCWLCIFSASFWFHWLIHQFPDPFLPPSPWSDSRLNSCIQVVIPPFKKHWHSCRGRVQ